MQPAVSHPPHARDLVLASGHAGHHVQFYADDADLVASVAEFVASGLTIGRPVVVIATAPHRAAFLHRLRAEDVDADAHVAANRLVLLDARETLDELMVNGRPDAARFRTVIGDIIENTRIRHDAPVVSMYGEMVDLLWGEGNRAAAIDLETLWNDLAGELAFSLLCAYAMARFDAPDSAPRFLEICAQHTHVLHLQRVAPNRSGYVLENVALTPVVAEAVGMLETLLLANRLTCDVSIASTAFAIAACADREKTREIVINLLTNAIKFTPAGGRVVVELSSGAIEPNTVRLRVTDTGIGIAPSQLDHLFEHLGLGLTMSRDHARAMGGDLTVSSALGVGTTFSLTLPAALGEP